MRGVFDDEEQELRPVQARHDTELTLGSGMLLAIFFGLVLLCGLCFGLGYVVGHHSSPAPLAPTTQSTASSASAAAGNSATKPAATTESTQPSSPEPADAGQSSATPSDATQTQPVPAQTAAAPGQAVSPAINAGQRPVLTPASAAQVGGPQAGGPMASGPMVQIAAISNVEDADVLTAALRKRGYGVTARRDPADNLIHVRIGPFASLAEANTWKMKLLSDGYNAIVQP